MHVRVSMLVSLPIAIGLGAVAYDVWSMIGGSLVGAVGLGAAVAVALWIGLAVALTAIVGRR